MVKNVIPLEHISRGITFLYMKKVAITNGSIGPVKIYAQNYLQAPAE